MSEASIPSSTASDNPILGAARVSYLDLFYATLFHPVSTFRSIAEQERPGNRLLFYALMSVVLVSACAPIVHIATMGGNPAGLLLSVPFCAIGGVLVWIFMALVVGLLSYAFTRHMYLRTFLILSGLATLPWIFMGLIGLLKIGLGTAGLLLSGILGFLVWLWSFLLFALALMHTYKMSPERVVIVLIMPAVMIIVFFGWLAGLINNFRHLAPL